MNPVKFKPEAFAKVEIGKDEESVCSPEKLPEGAQGIVINAPHSANFSGPASQWVLPLCAYYYINAPKLMNSPGPEVHLKHIETGAEAVGFMNDQDSSTSIPNPKAPTLKAEDLKDYYSAGYINRNVLSYIGELQTGGEYLIFVNYGGFRSNEIKIEIVLE